MDSKAKIILLIMALLVAWTCFDKYQDYNQKKDDIVIIRVPQNVDEDKLDKIKEALK